MIEFHAFSGSETMNAKDGRLGCHGRLDAMHATDSMDATDAMTPWMTMSHFMALLGFFNVLLKVLNGYPKFVEWFIELFSWFP